MRRIVYNLMLFCLVSILLGSCTNQTTHNYAVVSGKLTNGQGKKLSLISASTTVGLDTLSSFKKMIDLGEDGSFADTIYIDGKREFSLSRKHDFVTLVLQPGDNIHIEAEYNDLSQRKLSGSAAAYNEYINAKNEISNKHKLEDRTRREKSIKNNEEMFKQQTEDETLDYLQLLNSSTELTDDQIVREKKDIHYVKLIKYLYYDITYKSINGKDAPALSTDFMAVVSGTDMQNHNEYQNSAMYQFLIRAYYDSQYRKIANPFVDDPIKQLQLVKELVSDQNMINELFIMYGNFGIAKTPDVQAYYDYFMANVTNERYKEHVTAQYNDLISTQSGQPAPEFTNFENVNGGTNSLSDFRGKYVYIDVWATWCGPCIAEIPYLIEVEKQYHNKNIEFISLSIDNLRHRAKWKAFIKKQNLGGVQLIADKAWETEFINKFQIKSIPHFILIDPDGKIVDSKAPRPSDPKLIELFKVCGL